MEYEKLSMGTLIYIGKISKKIFVQAALKELCAVKGNMKINLFLNENLVLQNKYFKFYFYSVLLL